MRVREPDGPAALWVLSRVKRLALLARSFELKRVLVEGSANTGDGQRKLAYLGEGESLAWLKGAYFKRVDHEAVSRRSLLSLGGEVQRLAAGGATVFVEVNRWLDFLVPPGGWLTFPWLRQVVDLSQVDRKKRKKSVEAYVGRKVRQQGFRCRVSSDRADLVRFFRELYIPYLSWRFGAEANPRSLRQLETALRSGFLLQILDPDGWQAGSVCLRRSDWLTALTLGLRPDYETNLARGAISALYYFLFRFAEEKSIGWVDLMRSRPQADDGVYWHKKRWGARPEKAAWPHTCLRVFLPPGGSPPPRLARLMIWTGQGFVELGEMVPDRFGA